MQAFLLAAGLGTRLRPLTNRKPKALVEVNGTPLLKINIDNLTRQGASRIVVNVHHFADQVIDYIQRSSWETEVLVSDESCQLLDTGGGLKKAAPLFLPDDPIVIHNVDILSHIDIPSILKQHTQSMNLATLVVSQRQTARQLLFDSRRQLTGWTNHNSGETQWVQLPQSAYEEKAFSGIAVISPQLLSLLPPADHPYAIIPAYLNLAKNHGISYFEHLKEDWLDVGKPETLKLAQSWRLS